MVAFNELSLYYGKCFNPSQEHYNNLLHIKHLQQTSERENIVSKCKNVKRSELEQDRASVQSAELCPSGRQFRF